MQITIDPEFQALIPPLSPDELTQLEANLVADGCRDPLVTWQGTMLDGHNRKAICERHNIEFKTVEVEGIGTHQEAKAWVIRNQFGRRNLVAYERARLALMLKKLFSAKAKENQGARTDLTEPNFCQNSDKSSDKSKNENYKSPCQNSDKAISKPKVSRKPNKPLVVAPVDTKRELAKAARVSHDTIAKVEKIEAKSPESVKAKLRSGETTINKEYKAIVKAERKAKQVEDVKATPPLQGKFHVIVADPPWAYSSRAEDSTHRAANPYPSMTVQDISVMPIAECAYDNSILWLWTTNAFMVEAHQVAESWGFEVKTILTWAKNRMGTGDWLRGQTEHCLMCVRGKPVVELTNQTTLLHGPMREHSRKPDEFYLLVEALCPGSKCELFSRQQREGWSAFGAEVNKFDASIL